MEAVLYTREGIEKGKISLDDRFFGQTVHTGLIHRLLVLQQSNVRQAIAHTLTRGERRGSTRKLYRQKGTGNARAGASRSPVRKKGGVAFGPRNDRNFVLMMNKKERRLALLSLLSSKAQDARVRIIESLGEVSKTKEMVGLFQKMGVESAVFALNPTDAHLFQTVRNVPTVKAIGINYLNPKDLLKYRDLVFTQESLQSLGDIYK